jgi:uncharacterized protein with HEPN domain
MLVYARKAVSFVEDADLQAFLADDRMVLAVERAIEIFGEAAKNVGEAERQALPQFPWREVAGTRDVLAHGYASVDHELLFRVVRQHLPPLISALEILLAEDSR